MRAIEFISEVQQKGPRPETAALLAKIKEYYNEGWKPKEIAELLDISYSKVMSILDVHYKDRPGKQIKLGRALTDNDKEEIFKKWQSGQANTKIEKDYGVSDVTIRSIIIQKIGLENYNNEVKKRKEFGRAGYVKGTTPDQVAQMSKMHFSGMGLKAIGKIFNLSPRVIKRWLEKLPNYNEIYNSYLINRETKQRIPTTTSYTKAGTMDNLKSKGYGSKHTSGVQWR
jgi:uncharacterized protein YjcR